MATSNNRPSEGLKGLGDLLPSADGHEELLPTKEAVCEDHGAYMTSGRRLLWTKSKKELWSPCPTCDAEEKLAKEHDAVVDARRAEYQKLAGMLVQASVPKRFAGKTFDTYKAETDEQARIIAVCRSYAENFELNLKRGNGMIFSGNVGTGKSHMSASIIQAILPDYVGAYMTCRDLVLMVRDTWRKDSSTSESQVLHRLQSVPLLVLDEVGVQYDTDGEKVLLTDLLDRRYRECMPTIMMTNLDKEELKECLGERAFDRQVEVSRWLTFSWDSYRAIARKEAGGKP